MWRRSTLTANATVEDAKGGTLELLSGPVALHHPQRARKWDMTVDQIRFVAKFDRGGNLPVEVHFNAAVTSSNDWSAVDFRVAPSVGSRSCAGLAADTEFQFATRAAGTQRHKFHQLLPVDGAVKFAWRPARPAAEGKLFYAAEMTSQIRVSPGLMRQAALAQRQNHAGRNGPARVEAHGDGEVTRVQGDEVLSWNVENEFDRPRIWSSNSTSRRRILHNPGADADPARRVSAQSADAIQLQPEGATQFAGSFRVVNDGAVRLEVTQASGLSQISPKQVPEANMFRATGNERFAYRFQRRFCVAQPGGPDFAGGRRVAGARLQSRRK